MSRRAHPLNTTTSPERTASAPGLEDLGLGEFGRWGRWWLDTKGISGVVAPAVATVVAWAMHWTLVPLGLAAGLLVALVWGALGTRGKAAILLTFVLGPFGPLAALYFFRDSKPEPHYRAHWADSGEVSDMTAEDGAGVSDAVVLGTYGERREPLTVRPGQEGRREMGHFLFCGPTRSGKGLNLISNLMAWGGSAVALDVKGELYRTTAGIRADLPGAENRILVLDPAGRGDRYDPFVELSYSPEATRRAVDLILETDKARDPVFARRAGSALYAALVAARLEGAPTLAYVREATSEGPRTFVERLAALGDQEVRRALVDFLGDRPEDMQPEDYRNDRFLASAWGTLTAQLSGVLSDGILKMTGGSDFTAADLVERPTTLYLMFSESDLDYTKRMFEVVMLALMTGLIRRGDLDPEGESVPMLLALDEAGRTPIPRLDDMVSTIAGRGMSAMIYIQDLGQLDASYGRDRAQTIRGGCHTQVYYRPQDHATASHVSRVAGQTTVEDRRTNTKGGGESVGQRARELVTADEVRQMPHENVIAITGRKPPIMARRLEWFSFFEDAQGLVDRHRPPRPRDLDLPEVAPFATGDGPGSETGPGRNGRGRGAERERQPGGYVEPDV